jgi:hypothetical protein
VDRPVPIGRGHRRSIGPISRRTARAAAPPRLAARRCRCPRPRT